ncbi:hypothetical protein E4T42_04216 [Aureobasidium subglaciale]|nr:hypothetical protein E4T42_04216 [Aureobasidium subglaciale]
MGMRVSVVEVELDVEDRPAVIVENEPLFVAIVGLEAAADKLSVVIAVGKLPVEEAAANELAAGELLAEAVETVVDCWLPRLDEALLGKIALEDGLLGMAALDEVLLGKIAPDEELPGKTELDEELLERITFDEELERLELDKGPLVEVTLDDGLLVGARLEDRLLMTEDDMRPEDDDVDMPPVASTTVWPSTSGQEYVACDITAEVADKVVLAVVKPELDCKEELVTRLEEMREEELEAALDTELTEETRLTDELEMTLYEELELDDEALESEESADEELEATLDRELAEDDPMLIDELDVLGVTLENVMPAEEGPTDVDEVDNVLERAGDTLGNTLDDELKIEDKADEELDAALDRELSVDDPMLFADEEPGDMPFLIPATTFAPAVYVVCVTAADDELEVSPMVDEELVADKLVVGVTLGGELEIEGDNADEELEARIDDELGIEDEADKADEELEVEDEADEELKIRVDDELRLDVEALESEERADKVLDAILDRELAENDPMVLDEREVDEAVNEELAEEEPMLADDVDTTLEDTLDPEDRADEMDDSADETLEETLDAELDRELAEEEAMLVDELVELIRGLEVELEELVIEELVDDARELDELLLTVDDELVVINKELDEELVVVVV